MIGCGGGTDEEDAGGADAAAAMDAGGATDAGPETDAGDTTDAGPETDAGDATDAGPETDAGSSMDAGPSLDASTDAVITLSDVTVYANCMPSVPPDPINAFWTANVTGATGSAATLASATLSVTGPPSFTQTLTVDVPTISLSGGSGSQEQRKTGADRDPPGTCGMLCDSNYTLELTYMVDGASVVVSESGTLTCAF
jgi:hypothetical protein